MKFSVLSFAMSRELDHARIFRRAGEFLRGTRIAPDQGSPRMSAALPPANLHPHPSGAGPPAHRPQTSEDAGTEKRNETRREKVTPPEGGRKASFHATTPRQA